MLCATPSFDVRLYWGYIGNLGEGSLSFKVDMQLFIGILEVVCISISFQMNYHCSLEHAPYTELAKPCGMSIVILKMFQDYTEDTTNVFQGIISFHLK